jgi:hypothetical protein
MSNAPESVPFVRRVLQISIPEERCFTLNRHAAVVDQYAYSIFFTSGRQVLNWFWKTIVEKSQYWLCFVYVV